MHRRPSLITFAAISIALSLAGNLATGTIQISQQNRPWIWLTTAVLAAAAIAFEVSRQRPDQPASPQRGNPSHEHFLPRSQGILPTTLRHGWYFTGRVTVLRELVAWLSQPEGQPATDYRARVVTGGPGSGKSAVLGRLLCFADANIRRSIPMSEQARAASGTTVTVGGISVAVHARGRTVNEVAAEIAMGLGIAESTADGLLAALRTSDRARATGVIVDAVDEAADPRRLIIDLLEPLAAGGAMARLRLVIGTRRGAGDGLLLLFGTAVAVLDLDTPTYFDHADTIDYVRRCLLAEDDPQLPTPYRGQPAFALAVAQVVAARAGFSFLVAQLTSLALAAAPTAVTAAELDVPETFPATVGGAMERYIRDAGPDGRRLRDLLIPLAWAQGAGLADPGTWAALATAFGTREYREHDITHLMLDSRAADLLHRSESPRQVRYRLFHEALGEHLRHLATQSSTAALIEARFANVLLDRVPRTTTGQRDWSVVDDYTRSFLTVHAANGGMIDLLLDDPGCLAVIEPSRLLSAIRTATTRRGRERAAAVALVGQQLLVRPRSEQVSYLELAARVSGDNAFADQLAALHLPRPWTVPWARWTPSRSERILGHHDDYVCSLAVTTVDGDPIVIAASRWTMTYHRLTGSGSSIPPWRESQSPISAIAAFSDAKRLQTITLHTNGDLRRITTIGGTHRDELLSEQNTEGPWPVRIHGIDAVATSDSDGNLRITTIVDGRTRSKHTPPQISRIVDAATVRMAGQDRTVAVGATTDTTYEAWEVDSGNPLGTPIRPHEYLSRPDRGVWFNDIRILTAPDELSVLFILREPYASQSIEVVWQPDNPDPQVSHLTGIHNINAVAELLPTGSRCYGTALGALHLASTSDRPHSIPIHDSSFTCLTQADTNEGTVLISGGVDGTIRAFPTSDASFDAPSQIGRTLAASPPIEHDSQKLLLCYASDTTLETIDSTTGDTVNTIGLPHTINGRILSATSDPNGNLFVITSDAPDTILRMNLAGDHVASIPLPARIVDMSSTSLNATPILLVTTELGALHILDPETGAPQHPCASVSDQPIQMATHTIDSTLIVAAWDRFDHIGQVHLCRINRSQVNVTTLPIPITRDDNFGIMSGDFVSGPDYDAFVATGWGGHIQVWDLQQSVLALDTEMPTRSNSLNAVATVSAGNHNMILCGGYQTILRAWHPQHTQWPEIALGTPILGIRPTGEREVVIKGPRGVLQIRLEEHFVADVLDPLSSAISSDSIRRRSIQPTPHARQSLAH